MRLCVFFALAAFSLWLISLPSHSWQTPLTPARLLHHKNLQCWSSPRVGRRGGNTQRNTEDQDCIFYIVCFLRVLNADTIQSSLGHRNIRKECKFLLPGAQSRECVTPIQSFQHRVHFGINATLFTICFNIIKMSQRLNTGQSSLVRLPRGRWGWLIILLSRRPGPSLSVSTSLFHVFHSSGVIIVRNVLVSVRPFSLKSLLVGFAPAL